MRTTVPSTTSPCLRLLTSFVGIVEQLGHGHRLGLRPGPSRSAAAIRSRARPRPARRAVHRCSRVFGRGSSALRPFIGRGRCSCGRRRSASDRTRRPPPSSAASRSARPPARRSVRPLAALAAPPSRRLPWPGPPAPSADGRLGVGRAAPAAPRSRPRTAGLVGQVSLRSCRIRVPAAKNALRAEGVNVGAVRSCLSVTRSTGAPPGARPDRRALARGYAIVCYRAGEA